MSKITSFPLAGIFALSGFVGLDSCKKGSNDPALSLLTRKSRLENNWKIEMYSHEWKEEEGYDYTSGIESFDGDMVTSTWENRVGDSISSGYGTDTIFVLANEWDIGKDGTFTRKWNTLKHSTAKPTVNITVKSYVIHDETISGTWGFAGAEDAYKNKERIIFNATKQTLKTQTTKKTYVGTIESIEIGDTLDYEYTFAIGEYSETWNIDELRSHAFTLNSLTNSTLLLTTTDTSGTGTTSGSSIGHQWTMDLIER